MGTDDFRKELENLLNKHGIDSKCNTADFVLADYVVRSLEALAVATNHQKRLSTGGAIGEYCTFHPGNEQRLKDGAPPICECLSGGYSEMPTDCVYCVPVSDDWDAMKRATREKAHAKREDAHP